MAHPVFNCHSFNAFVFQNDCLEPEDEVAGGVPAMVIHREPDDDQVVGIMTAFLAGPGR